METDKKIPVHITVTGLHYSITEDTIEPSQEADEITGAAKDPSPEADTTTEAADGFFSRRGNSIYLTYNLPPVSNMIKITPGALEIKRTILLSFQKKLCSTIVYRTGTKENGVQDTPYGRLLTCTDTKSISINETDTCFTCKATGTMYINNSPTSEFELKIEAVIN